MAVKVMIADDHSMIREGLKQLLELEGDFEVIAEACDGVDCLEKLKTVVPDILLLDINMPNMNGLEVLQKMKDMKMKVKVLVLTVHNEVEYLLKAVDIGVNGYLLKDSESAELKKAILAVVNGEDYIQPSLIPVLNSKMLDRDSDSSKIESLTRRELEVLKMLSYGTYNKEKKRPMLALTFDDGPGEYTDELLDCLEENNAKATFFMLGPNVELYPDTVKRMQEMGCEIGSHSWHHWDLMTLDENGIAEEFSKTDEALIKACGQPASVARAPYGSADQHVYDIVQKPFFMWSLDTLDWQLLDAQADYDAVMNGDLTDGSIILMHDIHEPSVQAALKLIPDLVAKGYKLVTVSEMAEAKGVDLQNASYSDFWQSSFDNGLVAGYKGEDDSLTGGSEDEVSADSQGTVEDGTSDEVSDGSEGSMDESGEGDSSREEMSDGSSGEEA